MKRREQQLHASAASVHQSHRGAQIPRGGVERQPDVLRPGEFRARLGLGRSRFHELQQQGRFRRLVSPNVSAARGTTVYSRRKVEAWIEQEVRVTVGTRSV